MLGIWLKPPFYCPAGKSFYFLLINFRKTNNPQSSNDNFDKIISSLSEEIQNFDGYFNEISCDLSPYDVRQTQIATMQIKEKFLVLQDSLKPKKKFGFKSRNKKVSSYQRKDDRN